jgi:hypothetical protein
MMTLLSNTSPFRGFDREHPLLAYIIREVRGGRTPAGLARYSRQVMWIMLALAFGGLAVLLVFYQPQYRGGQWRQQAAALYTAGAFGVGMFSFVIVDVVTLFYAAVSLRGDIGRSVKFDLLRTSTLPPANYIAARLTLAQVRAWRVFIVMYAARVAACVLAAGVFTWIIGYNLIDYGPPVSEWEFLMTTASILLGVAIFLVLLLWEPFWRQRMLTALAASIAARVRRAVWMWLVLGGAYLLVVFLQGALAAGASTLGFWSADAVTNQFLPYEAYSWEFRNRVSVMVGFLPFMAMPPLVYRLQLWLTNWRWHVAEQYIFKQQGEDA